jgi:hypothetical protein
MEGHVFGSCENGVMVISRNHGLLAYRHQVGVYFLHLPVYALTSYPSVEVDSRKRQQYGNDSDNDNQLNNGKPAPVHAISPGYEAPS